MKKIVALLLIFLFCLSCGKKEPDANYMGAILPMAGDIAVYGNKMENAIELADEDANRTVILDNKKFKVITKHPRN